MYVLSAVRGREKRKNEEDVKARKKEENEKIFFLLSEFSYNSSDCNKKLSNISFHSRSAMCVECKSNFCGKKKSAFCSKFFYTNGLQEKM